MDDEDISPELEPLMFGIGMALSVWSGVEAQIGTLFWLASGIPNKAKAGRIHDSLVSFESRLAITAAALRGDPRLTTDEHRIWDRLQRRLMKFHKKRHAIAHFHITGPERGKPYGSGISPFFSWDKLPDGNQWMTRDMVDVRRQKFVELDRATFWLTQVVSSRTPGLQVPAQIPEEPTLIAHIRELLSRCPEGSATPA